MDSVQAQEFIEGLTGRVIGGWKIQGALGYGKSAVVMSGVKDGLTCAVKVFHRELIERFGKKVQLARINRELTLVGVKHEHLVEIVGGGECPETGHLFVVMEKLPWRNLKEALDQIPANKIDAIVSQLAAAAQFLESRALAHRDIKPENIAINEDFSIIKLLDLGVLKPYGIAGLTDVDARPFIGTLRYSSPEFLIRDEDDSPEGWKALSIYQISAVLHDLLMRKEIFSAFSEPFTVLANAVQHEVPEVHGENARLVRLCNYGLTKNPTTRLELVDWGSFKLDVDAGDVVAGLKKSIKDRQKYQVEKMAQLDAGGYAEARRLLKQQLEAVSGSLDLKVGIVVATANCFPLYSITPSVSVADSKAESRICFESDEALGLPQELTVHLELHLIDNNGGNGIYKLVAGGYIGAAPSKVLVESETLRVGNLNELTGEDVIEVWLLSVLEKAYEYIDITAK